MDYFVDTIFFVEDGIIRIALLEVVFLGAILAVVAGFLVAVFLAEAR